MWHNCFWWSIELRDFLFFGYNVHGIIGLLATWCGLFVLSFLIEWLKLLQSKHRQRQLVLRAREIRAICPTESSTLLNENRETLIPVTLMLRAKIFIYEMFLWLSLQNLGYILMLSVMFFNGWLMIAVVCGGGLGYFIFGNTFMKINIQNCQILKKTYCMANCPEPGPGGVTCLDGQSTPILDNSSTEEGNCHETHTATIHV